MRRHRGPQHHRHRGANSCHRSMAVRLRIGGHAVQQTTRSVEIRLRLNACGGTPRRPRQDWGQLDRNVDSHSVASWPDESTGGRTLSEMKLGVKLQWKSMGLLCGCSDASTDSLKLSQERSTDAMTSTVRARQLRNAHDGQARETHSLRLLKTLLM